mmetsp:Transcript_11363/g.36002  ORF Transcript_11363/g.36002 Transcript_11363/m.36002 type:complete len:231 (-) Transcript_11363:369-1061(-)
MRETTEVMFWSICSSRSWLVERSRRITCARLSKRPLTSNPARRCSPSGTWFLSREVAHFPEPPWSAWGRFRWVYGCRGMEFPATCPTMLCSAPEEANQAYFIMAGANHGEGAVLTRGRTNLIDAWHLYETPAKDTKGINKQPDWFRLQTNYDHWTPAPSYDDRRTPGVTHGSQFCKSGVDMDCVLKVMTTWPTKNFHTDITSVMCPKTGYISTTVWSPSLSSSVAGTIVV